MLKWMNIIYTECDDDDDDDDGVLSIYWNWGVQTEYRHFVLNNVSMLHKYKYNWTLKKRKTQQAYFSHFNQCWPSFGEHHKKAVLEGNSSKYLTHDYSLAIKCLCNFKWLNQFAQYFNDQQ